MGSWTFFVLFLTLAHQCLDCIADNTFPPVIVNSPFIQPLQTAQNNVNLQASPSTSTEPQRAPTNRPILVTESPRLLQFRPASAIEFPKVPTKGPQLLTEAPQVSTSRLPPITEPFAISSTKPPPIAETPAPTTTSPSPIPSSILESPRLAPSSPPLFTEPPRSSPKPSFVTAIPIVTNISPTIISTTPTANITNPILPVTQSNRTTSTFSKFVQNFSPKLQTLRPQTIKLKDTRCSNNTDCNNGVCVDGKCYCSPGFSGFKCQINVDECAPNPCYNNATCINKVGEYECICPPGYTGEKCESEINMCQDNPCANNATCVNLLSRYECQCQSGFKGDQCEINIDDCYSKPCLNNGTCIDGIDKYTCDCKSTGYKGDLCEININDCEPNPCGQAARKCVDLIKGFKCECHDGFTGANCGEDIKECEKNPCLNGGTCLEKSHNLIKDASGSFTKNLNYSLYAGYKCECPEEYHGINCEEKKKCYTRPLIELCGNPNAQCIDNIDGSYECQINASFDGTEQHYAEYALVKELEKFRLEDIKVKYRSVKGGVILSFSTSQSALIELQLNETGLYFNGTLTELGPSSRMGLLDGREQEFRISLPPTDINRIYLARPFKGCLMQVWLNNHLLPFYSYGEEAYQIFDIKHINFDTDRCFVCFENDCMNDGQCADTMEGFSCNCPNTFTGIHCEEDVDECKNFPSPCENGQCENILGSYKCKCLPGFSGENCRDIHNICLAQSPCSTGTCKSNGSSSYHCECPSSHIGINCEIERNCSNECDEKHSQCIQNRTCACLPGISDRMEKCEFISSCEKHVGPLCQNGGTCSNLENDGYICLCQEGFQGSVCESQVAQPQFNVVVLLVITCIGLLLATCAVVSLIIFKSVRRARATQGTYSPQSEEIYGDSARFDILKAPPEERLI